MNTAKGRYWETICPIRTRMFEEGNAADGQHCNCWYDGSACCACNAPAEVSNAEDS